MFYYTKKPFEWRFLMLAPQMGRFSNFWVGIHGKICGINWQIIGNPLICQNARKRILGIFLSCTSKERPRYILCIEARTKAHVYEGS